jgi:hypothetical protein
MEKAPKNKEATTILFDPNRVAKIPPIRENRRYPRRMLPLRSPISI